ncbi:MAG: alpha-L-glycero-D-manno-heptose alpha-1,3-glucosyltransferase, partial [Actinomycetia bacterium]|nr:alpha-L-glycero-D-manno-heptose alpha-1,3-glucosyltransferase [Actinomycetes bacterium]
MKILHTCATYWPLVDGVSVAMQRISEGLAAHGHDVTVATGAVAGAVDEHAGVQIVRFAITGNETLGYQGDTTAYQEFVRHFAGDIMLNYAAQIWSSD